MLECLSLLIVYANAVLHLVPRQVLACVWQHVLAVLQALSLDGRQAYVVTRVDLAGTSQVRRLRDS